MLDPEELLHLAAHASVRGNPHAALTYLKELLRLDPENARAIYLLAVQHAQIGLASRAVAGLTAALNLDPRLEAARLRLAMLLLLDENRQAEAKQHLSELGNSVDRAMVLYSQALVAVADNDRARARELIARGLELPPSGSGLTALMHSLREILGQEGDATRTETARPAEVAVEHADAFLGAYRDPRR